MKNIHVLPTDKPSRYWMSKVTNNLNFGNPDLESGICKFKNINITSDEEIKEGDWMIRGNEQPIKVTKDFFWDFGVKYYKIILTTDQDLIKDGVQAIDDEFLEWFVKNPSCEEVEIGKIALVSDNGTVLYDIKYKIIIPKEENIYDEYLKDELKKYKDVKTIVFNKPKQETLEETLEEAAERIYDDNLFNYEKYRAGFIKGAKWRQEHYGLMEIELRRTKTLLESCQKSLEERDKQQQGYSEEVVELVANEMVNWAIANIGNPNPQSGKKFDEVLKKFRNK